MTGPKLKTFCHSEETVIAAIESGFEALVLDDSKVSIRSYSLDYTVSNYDKYSVLAKLARELNPNIELSVCCDLLIHHRHFDRVDAVLEAMTQANISTIRVQDTGLLLYIKEKAPHLSVDLHWETGNHNLLSMQAYEPHVQTQHLSNEIPVDILKEARTGLSNALEIQIQGPILIQYSNRRYMAGLMYSSEKNLSQDEIPPLYRLAEDADYPNRKFPFCDTEHGHFMYAYFDRCLLRYIPDLMSCNLEYWVIDGRGESVAYLKEAGRVYTAERDRFLAAPDTYALDKANFESLKSVATRPQKVGFFRANKTDQVREKHHTNQPENSVYLGTIIDSIKGRQVTVEFEHPPTLGESPILCLTPDGRTIEVVPRILQTHSPTLLTMHWQKGLSVKTRLYQLS